MYSDTEWRGAVGKTKDKTGDGNRIGRRSDEKKMKCSGYYILLDVCNANWRVITLILKLKEQEKERGHREECILISVLRKVAQDRSHSNVPILPIPQML